MRAGHGRQVPGDDERRDGLVYDERHDDQLSGGDELRGREVHRHGWSKLVHDLPLVEYVCGRPDELLL